ncbi:MAG: sigma factor-like helix-turn-helix DNA-binding protein [Candidatus Freyarchaeota archaeon]
MQPGWTQEEIGEMFGITKVRVSQIVKKFRYRSFFYSPLRLFHAPSPNKPQSKPHRREEEGQLTQLFEILFMFFNYYVHLFLQCCKRNSYFL